MKFVDYHPWWQWASASAVIFLTAMMVLDWRIDVRWLAVLYFAIFAAMCSVSWGKWK